MTPHVLIVWASRTPGYGSAAWELGDVIDIVPGDHTFTDADLARQAFRLFRVDLTDTEKAALLDSGDVNKLTGLAERFRRVHLPVWRWPVAPHSNAITPLSRTDLYAMLADH